MLARSPKHGFAQFVSNELSCKRHADLVSSTRIDEAYANPFNTGGNPRFLTNGEKVARGQVLISSWPPSNLDNALMHRQVLKMLPPALPVFTLKCTRKGGAGKARGTPFLRVDGALDFGLFLSLFETLPGEYCFIDKDWPENGGTAGQPDSQEFGF